MSDIANSLYGDDGGGAAQVAKPAAPETDSTAASIFSEAPAAAGNPLGDGTVHSNLRGHLQDLVDAGQVELGDALRIGRSITAEADAIGLHGAELDVALRDVARPIEPKAAQRQRGEAVAALRREYGDRAEQVLAAGLKELRAKAPTLAAALASSAAGNDPALVRHVARLGEQTIGRKR